jgi:hypothetical protein
LLDLTRIEGGKMLAASLLFGLLAGLLAGVASLLAGFSLWAALGLAVVAANAGLLLGSVAAVRSPGASGRDAGPGATVVHPAE